MSQARTARLAAKGEAAERPRFTRFLVVGGIAAAVNILSRMAFSLGISYGAAIVVAYVCGMTTAYVLNKLFVFAPSGRTVHDEYLRFTIVNLVALAQVWIVSEGLAFVIFPASGFAWHAETIAHIVGVVIPTISSYLGHRHFSFAAPR
ncbi:MAG: GtrA family protein [Terriglobales bacterium]